FRSPNHLRRICQWGRYGTGESTAGGKGIETRRCSRQFTGQLRVHRRRDDIFPLPFFRFGNNLAISRGTYLGSILVDSPKYDGQEQTEYDSEGTDAQIYTPSFAAKAGASFSSI